VAHGLRSRRLKDAERRKLRRLAEKLGAKGPAVGDMPTHMAWMMSRGYGRSADEAEQDVLSRLRSPEDPVDS